MIQKTSTVPAGIGYGHDDLEDSPDESSDEIKRAPPKPEYKTRKTRVIKGKLVSLYEAGSIDESSGDKGEVLESLQSSISLKIKDEDARLITTLSSPSKSINIDHVKTQRKKWGTKVALMRTLLLSEEGPPQQPGFEVEDELEYVSDTEKTKSV